MDERTLKRLLNYARQIAILIDKTHNYGSIDRDDLIQTAYLGMWEAYLRFDPEKSDSLLHFCGHRIRGSVWDQFRTEARNFKNIKNFENSEISNFYCKNLDNEDEEERFLIEGNFDREILEKALKSLTPRQELVLRLRYLEEVPFPKVVEFLGITESGVCHLSQRALFNLRKYLKISVKEKKTSQLILYPSPLKFPAQNTVK